MHTVVTTTLSVLRGFSTKGKEKKQPPESLLSFCHTRRTTTKKTAFHRKFQPGNFNPWRWALKGKFVTFDVGLYEVLINSHCVTCSRGLSAPPLCGVEEGHRTTVNPNQQHVLNIFGALRCRQTAFSFGTTLLQPYNICIPARNWNVVPEKKAVRQKQKAKSTLRF